MSKSGLNLRHLNCCEVLEFVNLCLFLSIIHVDFLYSLLLGFVFRRVLVNFIDLPIRRYCRLCPSYIFRP